MIRFGERFIPAILDGTKTMTVRLEDKRRVREIEAVVVDYDYPFPRAWIQYTYKDCLPLNAVDVTHEGFTHIDDLVNFLRGVYGSARIPNSEITVWQYTFKVVPEPEIKEES